MRIKYRVGVMPGPWPDENPPTSGDGGVQFLWRFVDLCEQSGIDSVWFSERLSSPLPVPEPMTTIAAVAARSQRLKFGPSVLIMPFRTPVLAAREMAMIDHLSGGRMLPAVGIGVESEREFLAAGVPFKERGRRTDEAIRIMRMCWEQDEVTFDGDFWKLDRVAVRPKPAQKPFPLWIGGNSEAAMRRAGRLGDGWIPSFVTPAQLRIGVDRTQAFAREAGREVPVDHFGALFYFGIDADGVSARAAAEPFIPKGRVDDATLRQCSAFGPPEIVAERIEQYIAAGASKFVLRPMCPPGQMLDQLAMLAEAVIPPIHAR
jgi:probable F420-dependent oxidoreductase